MTKRHVFMVSAVILFLVSIHILSAEDAVSYINDIKPVLQDNSCIVCHSYMGTYSGLTSQTSFSTQSGAAIVDTEDPDSSVLLWRLNGKKLDETPVGIMPQGGDPLPAQTIAMVKTWIEQGAPEEAPVDVEDNDTWSEIKNRFKAE